MKRAQEVNTTPRKNLSHSDGKLQTWVKKRLHTLSADHLQTDHIGAMSLTSPMIAKEIAEYAITLPGVDPSTSVVIDACAGIGGNTTAFANYFNNIIAFEPTSRFTHLCNNVKSLFQRFLNIQYRKINYSIVTPTTNTDIVFYDPPWGGNNYRFEESVSLTFGGRSLVEWIKLTPQRYIICKVPVNYDLTEIKKISKIHHEQKYEKPNTMRILYLSK